MPYHQALYLLPRLHLQLPLNKRPIVTSFSNDALHSMLYTLLSLLFLKTVNLYRIIHERGKYEYKLFPDQSTSIFEPISINRILRIILLRKFLRSWLRSTNESTAVIFLESLKKPT